MQRLNLEELVSYGRSLIRDDWRVAAAVTILFPFILTYLHTSLRSFLAVRSSGAVKTPPIVPYITPFVGNALSFAFNTRKLLDSLIASYGHIPVRLRLAHERLFYISGAENVLALFRHSRDLTTVPATILVLEAGFGSPATSNVVYTRDNTGVLAAPLPGSNPLPAHERIHYLTHKNLHENLTGGKPLAELAARFMSNLEEELFEVDIGSDSWTEIDDFYGLVQEVVFKASTTALCGRHILESNPTLAKDFWVYDTHLVQLFKQMPRWMAPKSHAARDKVLSAIEKWHRIAKDEFDWEDEEQTKSEFEEWYGCKMMRERARDFAKIDGLDSVAIAASDLGMIWAANANIVPIIGWMLIDSLFRPDLLSRVQAEIAHCTITTSPGHSTVSISTLLSNPLLQSIYAEELRLRGSLMIQRVPIIDNFKIGPWRFPKGKMIVASSWHEQRDREIWNERGGKYSVEEFYAERFLTIEGDPESGPRKPKTTGKANGAQDKVDDAETGDSKATRSVKFSTDTVNGSFIPYGGGQKMCPGRFYAKQEALGGVALFLRTFDVDIGLGGRDEGDDGKEWKKWKQAMPGMNMNFFAFGVIPPKQKVKARLRRKRDA